MIYLLFPIILVVFIIKGKTILQKFKMFFKNYKFLIVIEILLIIIILIINMFSTTIIIKEKDPHSNKELKSTILSEGEIYEYCSQITEFVENDSNDYKLLNYNINENIVIKKVGKSKVTIEKNGEEIEYNYGEGFWYYGTNSCNCGTPITFHKRTYQILKILILSIIVINLIIICRMKENKQKGDVK